MGRLSKYRIWDKELNKFVSINIDNATLKYQGDCWLLTSPGRHTDYFPFIRVNDNPRFEMQQFTGIYDREGIPIYAGDIVLLIDYHSYADVMEYGFNPNQIAEVIWLGSAWQYRIRECEILVIRDEIGDSTVDYQCQVIGNIFEDPYLINR